MRFSHLLLTASLGLATPTYQQNKLHERDNGVKWGRCNEPKLANSTLLCATMKVPLDYTDPDCEKIRLDIVKSPAPKGPSKGSIFYNFGGPGAPGTDEMLVYASDIHVATGQQHDIVNVIPRGTNDTLPFACYSDEISRGVGTQIVAGNSSDVALGRMWAQATLFSLNCGAAQNETGRFIGTAFTARDIMQVVDAIESDKMLRFWGISYGTLLGSTLAAMFPERIDRMVIDGVVNPHEYYQNREVEILDDTDATFRGFIEGCAANPKLCPFAKNQTADEIEELMVEFFEALRVNPMPMPTPGLAVGGSLFDSSAAQAYIIGQLYWPHLWPRVARLIAAVMEGDFEAIVKILEEQQAPPPPPGSFIPKDQEAQFGIKCSDVLDSGKGNLTELTPLFESRHAKSRFFGDAADESPARCGQWTLPAKERYDGDFKVKTNTGILVIGNSYDPVSPLASARNVSETFEGSSLLHQDGAYGHTSTAQISLCTAKAIRSYFLDGTLPESGTKCPVNVPLFSEKTGWEEVRKELGQ